MALGTSSGCINHPGVDATARCKQCSTPVCNACKVAAPGGTFCSDECKTKYETFVQRAAQLDAMKKPSMFGRKLRWFIGKVIVILILVVGVGLVGSYIDVPFLHPFVMWVRELIGI